MSNINPYSPKPLRTVPVGPTRSKTFTSVFMVIGCFATALILSNGRYNETFETVEVDMLPAEQPLLQQADTIAAAIAEAESIGENKFGVTSPPKQEVRKIRPPAERKTAPKPKKKVEYQITGGRLYYDKGPFRKGRYLGNPASFIAAIVPYARKVHAQTGLPVSTIIAQCVIESRYGVSGLSLNHLNFFGYKCQERNCGKGKHCVNMADDTPHDRFRSFKTAGEAFQAYADLLKNPRYKAACNQSGRFAGKRAAIALKRAGYATARNYADILIGVIEKYDLDQYDK